MHGGSPICRFQLFRALRFSDALQPKVHIGDVIHTISNPGTELQHFYNANSESISSMMPIELDWENKKESKSRFF